VCAAVAAMAQLKSMTRISLSRLTVLGITLLLPAAQSLLAKEDNPAAKRLNEAASTLGDIMKADDKSIPQDLLDKAQCMVIVPGLKKAGFILGGKFGRGFVTCRGKDGTGWSAPGAIRIEGGSVGFQIGATEVDVIAIVLNQHGMDKLLSDKFTVGADATAAAGPVGRTSTAQTDAAMRAEILTWSRSRGLFAGIALDGATMRPDVDANFELYGKKVDNRAVVMGEVTAPPAAAPLLELLNKYSSRKTK
jgi:SH3 domain-containing YSC84-like protein 1